MWNSAHVVKTTLFFCQKNVHKIPPMLTALIPYATMAVIPIQRLGFYIVLNSRHSLPDRAETQSLGCDRYLSQITMLIWTVGRWRSLSPAPASRVIPTAVDHTHQLTVLSNRDRPHPSASHDWHAVSAHPPHCIPPAAPSALGSQQRSIIGAKWRIAFINTNPKTDLITSQQVKVNPLLNLL